MGITEYVSSTHTFRILICSFDTETVAVARRIHRALPQSCGLYTYVSDGPGHSDGLYDVVARQYEKLLHVKFKATPDPAAVVNGWNPTLVALLQRVFGIPESVAARREGPDVQILLSARALDEAEIRNDIADAIATALRRAGL